MSKSEIQRLADRAQYTESGAFVDWRVVSAALAGEKLADAVQVTLGYESPDDSIEVYNVRRALDDFRDACRRTTHVNPAHLAARKAVAA